MTEQELIIAAKAPTDAYNKKDWNAMKSSITPDCTYDEVSTHRTIKGLDQVVEVWQNWAKAIPNSSATFENACVSGGKVILEVTWRGKHTGTLQTPNAEIPATGKEISLRACQIVEIENGKAKSMRQYFDMMTMMQQLGIV